MAVIYCLELQTHVDLDYFMEHIDECENCKQIYEGKGGREISMEEFLIEEFSIDDQDPLEGGLSAWEEYSLLKEFELSKGLIYNE